MSEVLIKAQQAQTAARTLALASAEQKNTALFAIAKTLMNRTPLILEANADDLDRGQKAGMTEALLDRLRLSEERLKGIAVGLEELMALPDPIGTLQETIRRPNGLTIQKVQVPLGVVGIIYEARPNVTVDAAGLCLKTGNAVLLRGSSSALASNRALTQAIQAGLEETGLPTHGVQLIEDAHRRRAAELFRLDDYLDVLIPRGGHQLIQAVKQNASVPVLETGVGNCHIFIDGSANYETAKNIVLNAKTQRPSVCNAVETLLVHEDWADHHLSSLLDALKESGVELRGDARARTHDETISQAVEDDWHAEYLALILAVKVVRSLEEAIDHITTYGTQHSEAIITENAEHAKRFFQGVDAACLYHNASTRFTDGYEFGFGAEIGISTQKLHARGPMGLSALTTSKYLVLGNGQIRD